jgi:hypothetical protein
MGGCKLEEIIFESFNIFFETNVISVELAKVLRYSLKVFLVKWGSQNIMSKRLQTKYTWNFLK